LAYVGSSGLSDIGAPGLTDIGTTGLTDVGSAWLADVDSIARAAWKLAGPVLQELCGGAGAECAAGRCAAAGQR